MKYLFVNSVAGIGSTGRIAADKCRELQKDGHQCVIAYGRQKANCEDIETWQIGTAWDYRMHGLRTRLFDQHGFGSVKATKKFLQKVKEYDPDIIWLHNIHGYYINIELLFDYLKSCGKEIRWTLHDCWAFTGHCSYFTAAKCEQWKERCVNCPQLRCYPACYTIGNISKNFERKKVAFTGVKNMFLITPSNWLANLVKQSFLNEYKVEVRYNTIDTNVFKPRPSGLREKHKLQDKFIVLGVASIWDERKGLQDFVKLSGMLDEHKYKIVIVGLSKKQIQVLPKSIIGLEATESAKELAGIYTTSNVFVNPTYEDNYPTVNLEAQACGITVITYDTGGSPESVQIENVVSCGDVRTLYQRIVCVCEKETAKITQ